MSTSNFLARAETFGLETAEPWAMPALRLLFTTPRAYLPIVQAWDTRYPGVKDSLDRLTGLGLVAYQGPVIVDTRTGQLAERASRRVTRYRTTERGRKLAQAVREDERVLTDMYPRVAEHTATSIITLLLACDLEHSHATYGISIAHACALAGIKEPLGKWWIARWLQDGVLKKLDQTYADVREIVPEHWRVTRALCRQVSDVLTTFDTHPGLDMAFRLNRSRILTDISPARVGLTGASDFDHDVTCQRILAKMLASPSAHTDSLFATEPRIVLPATLHREGLAFAHGAAGNVTYQPDAELREVGANGTLRRCVLEYERFQSRRDAWSHIERLLGHMHLSTVPSEAAVLRFVVNSTSRERSYVRLIEAFADYVLDHPERMPRNPVTLAVSSTPRLLKAADALADQAWFRVTLPNGADPSTARTPVLHHDEFSPYQDYFGRN